MHPAVWYITRTHARTHAHKHARTHTHEILRPLVKLTRATAFPWKLSFDCKFLLMSFPILGIIEISV